MIGRFSSWRDFINMGKRLTQRDQDNVMWFSGPAGAGKSNLSQLLNRKLDDTFEPAVIAGEPRITFDNLTFLRSTIQVEATQAVDGDELDLFGRGVMKGEQMALLRWLKDSRGRCLHVSLKFPDEGLVDEKLMLFRARWRIHSFEDHSFKIFVPKEPHQRNPDIPFGMWREVYSADPPPMVAGPLRDAYKLLKDTHMRESAIKLADELQYQEDKRRGGATRRPGARGIVEAPSTLPPWDPSAGSSVPAPLRPLDRLQRRLATQQPREDGPAKHTQ